ncbi:AAA family ATPase [Changchengzhania lutea]|uniref:AAA family ATPase n=1 Tax=Changchengzhania lutea TaxID=2049305 RepID=UPI00115CE57A|nr:AAA family ATPase [Changchengzhania lutea]
MKTIRIKSLKLTNFKGIRSLELNELSKETFIYGANAVGKTSVFDAFIWLLFGKDSTDRKSFEVQRLDLKNNVIPKLEVQVTSILHVDGERVELTRIMRQDWTKPKGSLIAVLKGNNTVYEWNGVPMKASEFSSKINAIVDENIFKMITSTTAFNSLHWLKQRDVLIDMAGNISDIEVLDAISNIENKSEVLKLTNVLNSSKSIDEYKKELNSKVLKSKKELQTLPTRIDEVERSKPVDLDFTKLKADLEIKTKAIESVNDKVSDKLKAQQADIDSQSVIQKEIHAIETEISNKKHEINQKASADFNESQNLPREIQRKIDAVDHEIKSNDSAISINNSKTSSYANQIGDLDKSIKDLRAQWEVENAKVFKMDDADCACPTCKRDFEASDIEDKKKDLQEHFTSNKNAKLKSITDRGQSLSGQKMTLENNLLELTKELGMLQESNKIAWEKRADLSEQLKASSTSKTQIEIYADLMNSEKLFFDSKTSDIATKRESLANRPKVDTSELKEELNRLNAERDEIKSQLQKEQQIEASNKRIAELSKEETQLAQSIADLEKELFTMEAFEKEKSTRIENSVNQRFKYVDFKLFETQINGGEVPTCKALIKGVPFSDANNASRINAGVDIINTLCQHYKVTAPIFIDNRESVSELIDTESQVVNLIVSKPDIELRVSDVPQTYEEYKLSKELQTA